MTTRPPGTEPAALLAFSMIDALLRKLVDQQTIMAADAVDMLSGIHEALARENRSGTKEVIPLLEKMIEEYRKQAR